MESTHRSFRDKNFKVMKLIKVFLCDHDYRNLQIIIVCVVLKKSKGLTIVLAYLHFLFMKYLFGM